MTKRQADQDSKPAEGPLTRAKRVSLSAPSPSRSYELRCRSPTVEKLKSDEPKSGVKVTPSRRKRDSESSTVPASAEKKTTRSSSRESGRRSLNFEEAKSALKPVRKSMRGKPAEETIQEDGEELKADAPQAPEVSSTEKDIRQSTEEETLTLRLSDGENEVESGASKSLDENVSKGKETVEKISKDLGNPEEVTKEIIIVEPVSLTEGGVSDEQQEESKGDVDVEEGKPCEGKQKTSAEIETSGMVMESQADEIQTSCGSESPKKSLVQDVDNESTSSLSVERSAVENIDKVASSANELEEQAKDEGSAGSTVAEENSEVQEPAEGQEHSTLSEKKKESISSPVKLAEETSRNKKDGKPSVSPCKKEGKFYVSPYKKEVKSSIPPSKKNEQPKESSPDKTNRKSSISPAKKNEQAVSSIEKMDEEPSPSKKDGKSSNSSVKEAGKTSISPRKENEESFSSSDKVDKEPSPSKESISSSDRVDKEPSPSKEDGKSSTCPVKEVGKTSISPNKMVEQSISSPGKTNEEPFLSRQNGKFSTSPVKEEGKTSIYPNKKAEESISSFNKVDPLELSPSKKDGKSYTSSVKEAGKPSTSPVEEFGKNLIYPSKTKDELSFSIDKTNEEPSSSSPKKSDEVQKQDEDEPMSTSTCMGTDEPVVTPAKKKCDQPTTTSSNDTEPITQKDQAAATPLKSPPCKRPVENGEGAGSPKKIKKDDCKIDMEEFLEKLKDGAEDDPGFTVKKEGDVDSEDDEGSELNVSKTDHPFPAYVYRLGKGTNAYNIREALKTQGLSEIDIIDVSCREDDFDRGCGYAHVYFSNEEEFMKAVDQSTKLFLLGKKMFIAPDKKYKPQSVKALIWHQNRALRIENKRLTEEVRSLRKEVVLWKRIAQGKNPNRSDDAKENTKHGLGQNRGRGGIRGHYQRGGPPKRIFT